MDDSENKVVLPTIWAKIISNFIFSVNHNVLQCNKSNYVERPLQVAGYVNSLLYLLFISQAVYIFVFLFTIMDQIIEHFLR